MKRKLLALSMAALLTLSMSFTAFAASSSTGSSSSSSSKSSSSSSSSSSDDSSSSSSSSSAASSSTASSETTVENAAAGGAVSAKTVTVAVVNADGTVSAAKLDDVISAAQAVITSSAVTSQQAVVTVQALMTTAPTAFFSQTVEALAAMKGSAMVVNDMGTIKTAAVAVDAFGNNIASAGVVKNVTSGALVMLMSVNADGAIEYVEGVVDPVTGAVMGAFQGIPTVITVLVLA